MKRLLLSTAFLLLAGNAYALNDDINSNNVNNGSFVGVAGNNSGTINNGAGSGATTIAPVAAGGSVTASGNSANFNTLQGGSQTASTGNQSVSVAAQARNPVGTAWAAPLVAADDTCMGSSSAGGQGVGLGLSFGTTWKDEDCVRRKDARELHNMGLRPAAVALMCDSRAVRRAMQAAGTPCPAEVEERADTPAYPALANTDSPKH